MRNFDAATAAALSARAGLVARQTLWITARNLATGLPESLGIWNGEDDISLSVEGTPRAYTGAGAALEVEPITAAPGLEVRTVVWRLSALAPEVEALAKAYDTRFAPVEIHRALFDPATRGLIGAPHRVFRGFCNGLTFDRGDAGGTAAADLELVSETRALTRSLAVKKSDESQKARGGDRFRRYGDISGSVPVYWGEKRLGGMAAPAGPVSSYRKKSHADDR